MRRHKTIALLTGVLAAAGTLTAAPASAISLPDLKVTASVPAGRYVVGEEFKVTVTIANIGTATATGIRGGLSSRTGSYPIVTDTDWAELRGLPGGTLAAGKSRTLTVRAKFQDWGGAPALQASVYETSQDADFANNGAAVPLTLISPEVTDTVSGSVYADRNGDAKPEAGEELAGVRVGFGQAVAETDAAGKFTVTGVPARMYDTAGLFYAPDGWVVPWFTQLKVDGTGKNNALLVRAVRPLDESLHASLSLDKESYSNSGETVKITAGLQNTGDFPITGVHADCPRSEDTALTPRDWGVLAPGAAGGTIPAHGTAEFTSIALVSMKAAAVGRTSIVCNFSTDYSFNAPWANADAKVVGKLGPVTVKLINDTNHNGSLDPGEAVAEVKAELYQGDAPAAATATSDADGRLVFSPVPVGEYQVRLLGPWTVDYSYVDVVAVPFEKTYPFLVRPAA